MVKDLDWDLALLVHCIDMSENARVTKHSGAFRSFCSRNCHFNSDKKVVVRITYNLEAFV